MIESLCSQQHQQQQIQQRAHRTINEDDKLRCTGRQEKQEGAIAAVRVIGNDCDRIDGCNDSVDKKPSLFDGESCIIELKSRGASLASSDTNNDECLNISKTNSMLETRTPMSKQLSTNTSMSSNGISSCSPESSSSPAFSSTSPSLATLSPSAQMISCQQNKNVNSNSAGEPERRYRPQKYCAVCGDKAIACNFNAVTCESCKAFFRRNAFKEQQLKCLFESSCIIDRVTRRFCSKCRLLKCFKIGMKREWILTDEQKQIKRVKIMQNKQSRQQVSTSSESTLVEDELNLSLGKRIEQTKRNLKQHEGDKINSVLSTEVVRVSDDELIATTSFTNSATQTSISQTELLRTINKYGIETRDASTSCPDETDLSNGLIEHYCSLSQQCRYCSTSISSVLRSSDLEQFNQLPQYDRNQHASTYNNQHHHHQYALNYQRPTQIGVENSDVQVAGQTTHSSTSNLAINYGSNSQTELIGSQQYSASMEDCSPGCCCQSNSTSNHFNVSQQQEQQNFLSQQSSDHMLGLTRSSVELENNVSTESPSFQICQQPDLHVLRPASEATRTTTAVNLTRTRLAQPQGSSGDAYRSDSSQWSNQSEEKNEPGSREHDGDRSQAPVSKNDLDQTSSCLSVTKDACQSSSSSRSYQNPFKIALEAMNVANSLVQDQRESESKDCSSSNEDFSNAFQVANCWPSCSYSSQTHASHVNNKQTEISSLNRAMMNGSSNSASENNSIASNNQLNNQIEARDSQTIASEMKVANGSSSQSSGTSVYVFWKGETFYSPAITEEDAIGRVERLDFSDSEKHLIHEMIDATKFIFRNTTDRVCSPTKLDDMVQFCDAALRRLIKSVKQIRAFRILSMDDQIKLLKTACFKILLLRSAFHFREEENGWLDERTGRRSCLEVLKEAKKSLVYEKHYRLLDQIGWPLRKDQIVISTLAMALLFEPGINLRHTSSVGLDNLIYLSILRKYLLCLQPDPLAKYERLVSALQLLDDCNDEYNVFFSKDFQPEQVTPLLIEIFDIPINNSN